MTAGSLPCRNKDIIKISITGYAVMVGYLAQPITR